jgi:hypothetical protein
VAHIPSNRARRGPSIGREGWELSRLEVDALLTIEIGLWTEVAGRIDSRLQRCSLKAHDGEA